jgi:hypothetical protein
VKTGVNRNILGATYELDPPENALMKPPGGHDALWGAFIFWSSINPNKSNRKGGGEVW